MVAKQEKEERCEDCIVETMAIVVCKNCITKRDDIVTKRYYTPSYDKEGICQG